MAPRFLVTVLLPLAIAGCGGGGASSTSVASRHSGRERQQIEVVCGNLTARLWGIAHKTALTRDPTLAAVVGKATPRRLVRAIVEARTALYEAAQVLEHDHIVAPRPRVVVSEAIEGYDHLRAELERADPRSRGEALAFLIKYERPTAYIAAGCASRLPAPNTIQ